MSDVKSLLLIDEACAFIAELLIGEILDQVIEGQFKPVPEEPQGPWFRPGGAIETLALQFLLKDGSEPTIKQLVGAGLAVALGDQIESRFAGAIVQIESG